MPGTLHLVGTPKQQFEEAEAPLGVLVGQRRLAASKSALGPVRRPRPLSSTSELAPFVTLPGVAGLSVNFPLGAVSACSVHLAVIFLLRPPLEAPRGGVLRSALNCVQSLTF